MRKLTLLLLLWVSAMTAQVSNGNETYSDYGFRSDPEQLQIPSVSDWISTIGTDGTFGKILPVNITIPYTPINYSASSQTLGAQISGIDVRLGQIGQTTALKANLASPVFTGMPEAPDPTTTQGLATKNYADNLVVGMLNDRGSWDASANLFPTTGGSGSGGVIRKGDMWFISVAGVLAGKAVTVGDSFRALTNTPGQTAGNWSVLEANIGYVPANDALVAHLAGTELFTGAKGFSTVTTFNNGTNDVKISRGSGANGRLIVFRPGDTTGAESVSFGGGTAELWIRGSMGQITHSGQNFIITNTVSGNTHLNADLGSLLLQNASTTGLAVMPSTRNIIIQNGGTFTDTGERLKVIGTTRLESAPIFTNVPTTSSGAYYILTGNNSTNQTEKVLSNTFAPNILTGYVSGAGAVSATDTPLQAIQKLNGNAPLFYTNSTTVAISSATLTSTYPSATIGSEVHALEITLGGMIYKKTATGWASIAAVVTP